MTRRASVVVFVFLMAFAVPGAVLARSHVIAQKSSKQLLGTIFLSARLSPGHGYRIEVIASGRQTFGGYGTETVVGVQHGRLFTGSPSLALNGTTPHSFAVSQPVNTKLSEWLLAVSVQLKSGRGLTVRIVDTGKH